MNQDRQRMQALELFLARLYTDTIFRKAFVESPEMVARNAGFDEATVATLLNMDWVGLELAAQSVGAKRQHSRAKAKGWRWLWRRG